MSGDAHIDELDPKDKRGRDAHKSRSWFIPEEGSGRSYDQEKAWGVFGGPDPRLQECLLHIDVAILPPPVCVLYFTIKKC